MLLENLKPHKMWFTDSSWVLQNKQRGLVTVNDIPKCKQSINHWFSHRYLHPRGHFGWFCFIFLFSYYWCSFFFFFDLNHLFFTLLHDHICNALKSIPIKFIFLYNFIVREYGMLYYELPLTCLLFHSIFLFTLNKIKNFK